jgi:RHS repeat-associated protein
MSYRYREYDPRAGRFISRDPFEYYPRTRLQGLATNRDEEAPEAASVGYAYAASNPVGNIDPRGLWWGIYHVQATTQQSRPAFAFDQPTLQALNQANVDVDSGITGAQLAWHYMADSSSRRGRLWCQVRSTGMLALTILAARSKAEECRAAAYDFAAGRRGIELLGSALHVLQDRSAHRCITMRQHGLQDEANSPRDFAGALTAAQIDTPQGSQSNWADCLADTRAYFAGYREQLEAAGWTERDVNCCVEEVFSRQ